MLGKELSAGWDIPAFEFEPDFAFGWAYGQSGIEMEVRVRLAVLVLAGIELIFFTVASMGLCFGFVLKTVLIIQGCFCYC